MLRWLVREQGILTAIKGLKEQMGLRGAPPLTAIQTSASLAIENGGTTRETPP